MPALPAAIINKLEINLTLVHQMHGPRHSFHPYFGGCMTLITVVSTGIAFPKLRRLSLEEDED